MTQDSKHPNPTRDARDRGIKVLTVLQELAMKTGSAGKLPVSERELWARNAHAIRARVGATGAGTAALFEAARSHAGDADDAPTDYEAFKKQLSDLCKPGRRQVKAYAGYLRFIEAVAQLTGEELTGLASELCTDIELEGKVSGLSARANSLANILGIVANRVGAKYDLVSQFQRLARLRERQLAMGGDCVWPDFHMAFEDGDYSPRPGLLVSEALVRLHASKQDLALARKARLLDRPLDSAGSVKPGSPESDLVQQLQGHFVHKPAQRQLAREAYYRESTLEEFGVSPLESAGGRAIVLKPFQECLGCLPMHYAGFLVTIHNGYGDRRFRDMSEMDHDTRWNFEQPFLQSLHGAGSDFETALTMRNHFAVFLYPDPGGQKLLPVAKIGEEEAICVVPLDAAHLHELANWIVLAADRPRELPYASESLLTYLERVVRNGTLEADWSRTVRYLEECPMHEAISKLRAQGVDVSLVSEE